ncbi:hypothetical protein C0J52_20603 [Blattella germanica]|nr:hypothetical protein C0J52_20603 [Blattella germanica]
MWRMRGKAQMTIIVMIVATSILILYRMSANDVAASNVPKESRVQISLDDNRFSTMTQNILQISKLRAGDSRILNDVRGYGRSENNLEPRLMYPRVNSEHTNDDVNNMERDSRGSWNNGIKPFNGYRMVHLDLKGAPPRVSYYEDFFPLIRNLGATGILIEYEDMFPFTGPELQDLPAYNAYSASDIKQILHLAAVNDLMVIPLIQTFGHLEFVLKLQKFIELREVEKYPQVICPTHNSTFDLLTAMIDQVIALHPGIKYLHIGCDEVYYLGECVRCGLTMVDHQWSKKQLFLHHHRDVIPLTWDDEFRELTSQELVQWGIPKLIEPVIWKYTPDVANSYHLENHQSWMNIISSYSDQLKFKGIFITGWQRYDHFAVLCELLPIGIPSLAVGLAYVQSENRGSSSIPRKVLDILKCDGTLPLSPGSGRTRCNFPGSEILEGVERLYMLQMNVEHATAELDRCKMELAYIEQDIRAAMSDVYDRYTITEWVSTFLQPLNNQLQSLWDAREKLLSRTYWPKRPLDILKPSIAHNL